MKEREKKGAKANVLKGFCVNARSIVNIDKRAELEIYMDKEKPAILAITESWAKETIQNSEIELDGYVMFRRDREQRTGRGRGGGVLLYVRDNLIAREKTDLRDERFEESLMCEIKKW